jgi:hypothetical protein
MTWRVFLTRAGGLVIEYSDGAKRCLYSASGGGMIEHNGHPDDWGPPRVAINHWQLMEALANMVPGDYSKESK